jgi:exodeoxyribonuclease VII small subunit
MSDLFDGIDNDNANLQNADVTEKQNKKIRVMKETSLADAKPIGLNTEDEMPFEVCLEKLEEIVVLLEKGDCNLTEALEAYKSGISLQKKCRDQLDSAEKMINQIYEESQKNK